MAFSAALETASAQSKAAATTTLTITNAVIIPAGRLLLVSIGKDNLATVDGDASEVLSVTDSAGNFYSKAYEYTNAQGAAAKGATASLWFSKLTADLLGTITITFSAATTAKAATAVSFSYGAGNTVLVTGQAFRADDNVDPGSLTSAGLSSGTQYLSYRVTAYEYASFTATATAAWTIPIQTGTTGGLNGANIGMFSEYKVATGATSQVTNPTLRKADSASIVVSFYESPIGSTSPPPVHPGRQYHPHLAR